MPLLQVSPGLQQVRVLSVSSGYNWWIRAWDYRMEVADRMRRLYQPQDAPTKSIGVKDRELVIELAEQIGARAPLIEFVHALNTRSTYRAYFEEYGRLVEQRSPARD